MAQTIKLKRSNTSNAVPSTSQLSLGELALNTADAKLYMRKYIDGSNSNDQIILIGDTSTIAATTLTGNLSMGDNVRAVFGSGNDLQIYHDGSHTRLNNATGNFNIQADDFHLTDSSNTTLRFRVDADGATDIRYNGSTKLVTTSSGISVTGGVVASAVSQFTDVNIPDNNAVRFGNSQDLQIYHDGSDSFIRDSGTGGLYIRASNFLSIQNAVGSETMIYAANDGAVELKYDNSTKFATTSTGVTVTGTGTFSGGNTNNTDAANILTLNASEHARLLVDTSSTGGHRASLVLESNGQETVLSTTGSASDLTVPVGDFTLDVAGNIILDADGRKISFKDGGTLALEIEKTASDVRFYSAIADNDIKFLGNDGGSTITPLYFDVSDGGAAFFGDDIRLYDLKSIRFGTDQDFRISFDGSTANIQNSTQDSDILFKGNDGGSTITALTLDMSESGKATFTGIVNSAVGFERGDLFITANEIDVSSGDLTLDVAGDIVLDADGADVILKDAGTEFGRFSRVTSDFVIKSATSDKDIIFKGVDGGSTITALTLDMSAAGAATFNSTVTSTGLTVNGSSTLSTVGIYANGTNATVAAVNGNDLELRGRSGQAVNIYSGGTLATQFDSSQNVILPNGSLMVGSTTAPDSKLTIYNAATGITGLVKLWTNTSNNTAADGGAIEWVGSGDKTAIGSKIAATRVEAGGKMDLRFYTGRNSDSDHEKMRILTDGKVGIGTAAPAGTLHVRDTVGQVYIQSNDGQSAQVIFGDATDPTRGGVEYTTTDDMVFSNNNFSEAMRIRYTGNVGIGTASPQTRFHVESSDGSGIRVSRSGASAYLQLFPAYSNVPTIMGLGAGGLHLGYNSDTAGIRITTANKVIIGDTVSHVDDLFQIETPASGGGHGIQIRRNDANGDQGIGRIMFGNNTDTDLAQIAAKTDGDSNAGDSGALFFSTQPTGGSLAERIRITSTGKVGIGTTAPQGNLSIKSGTNVDLELFSEASGASLQSYNRSSSSYGYIRFMTNSSGETARFDTSGNLGLGTTSPDTKLDITTSGVHGLILNQDTGSSNVSSRLFFRDSTRTNLILNVNGNLEFRTGGSVGSTSGTVRLAVKGDGSISFNNAYTFPTSDGSNGQALVTDGSGNITFGAVSAGAASSMVDADGDTKIQVEESSDEDKIRFDTAGTERMIIDASGNVGIGTASPDQPLHVVGADSGIKISSDASDRPHLSLFNGTSEMLRLSANNLYGAIGDSTDSQRYMVFKSGSIGIGTTAPSQALHLVSRNIYLQAGSLLMTQGTAYFMNSSNGAQRHGFHSTGYAFEAINVGIGTTAPASTLHVIGTNDGAGGITLGGPTENNSAQKVGRIKTAHYSTSEEPFTAILTNAQATSNLINIGGASGAENAATDIKFWTAGNNTTVTGSERMRIDSSGNVGIGATSPSQKVHVAFSGDNGLNIDSTDNHSSLYVTSGQGYGQYIRFADDSANYWINADTNGRLIFRPEGTSTSSKWTSFDSSGNVGIGTTTPDEFGIGGSFRYLAVGGSAIPGIINLVDNSTNGSYLQFGTAAGVRRASIHALDGSHLAFTVNGSNSGTGLTEAMRINNNGNVGIGTTAPTAKLDVRSANGGVHSRGQLYLTNTDSHAINQGSQISLGGTYSGTSDTYLGSIAARKENATSGDYAGYLQFGTRPSGAANVERMRITSTGNVGIGTTSPLTRLHLKETTEVALNLESTTARLRINNNNFISATSAVTTLGVNGSEKLRILANGNVGIGNTAPGEKFTIGSAASKGDIGFHIGGHRLITFGYMTTNSSETTYAGFPAEIRHDPSTGVLRFGIDGTTRSVGDSSSVSTALTIKTGGNVGIGTTSPAQKLDVSGNIAVGGTSVIDTNRRILAADGAANVPYITFASDTNTGLYRPGTDILGFSTAGSERARITDGGSLLVGTTAAVSTSSSQTGAEMRANGIIVGAVNGNVSFVGNRIGSDGEVAIFRRDGTNVGSLRAYGGDLIIQTGITGLRFNDGSNAIHPVIANGSVSDNVTNLGLSNARLHDAHFGGTVNVGENLVVTGDLTVNGTTTTLNTATLNVEDKNIVLNYGTGDTTSTADGAGITIQDAVDASTDAAIQWNTGNDRFNFTHGIRLPDSKKMQFGDGSDLEIYHNGSNSYIDDTGTGALNIRSSGIYLEKANGAEVMASFIADGAATLYHNGSAKITTASGGASVTGALSVSGNLGTGFFEIGDDTATTTATTQVSIASFSASSVRSCKLLVQITNTTDSTYHFTEIAIIHDGTDTYMTEYGSMFTGTAAEATFTSDISSGSVRLLATPASTDSMTFKVVRQMITA